MRTAVVTLAMATALSGCASTTTGGSTATEDSGSTGVAGEGEADASTICGDKPAVVGLADGFGGDTWRQIALAELRDEAAKCPNVTEVRYANANGDQQKAISDINGFVAQGVDIIIVLPDFGASMLPAMRAATAAGVTVIDYFVDLQGEVGVDYTAQVVQDSYGAGVAWADWYAEHLQSGNILLLGGPAGANSSTAFYEGLSTQLEEYPDLTLLGDNYVVTNWSPVDAQQAVAGAITQYGQIDGLASDYGVTAYAALQAFQAAGEPLPMVANIASNNRLDCFWNELNEQGEAFEFFSLEKTTTLTRNAFRRGMAEFQGIELDEPTRVSIPVGIDTLDNMPPPCDPNAPPDADLFSDLTPEQLAEVFNG